MIADRIRDMRKVGQLLLVLLAAFIISMWMVGDLWNAAAAARSKTLPDRRDVSPCTLHGHSSDCRGRGGERRLAYRSFPPGTT